MNTSQWREVLDAYTADLPADSEYWRVQAEMFALNGGRYNVHGNRYLREFDEMEV